MRCDLLEPCSNCQKAKKECVPSVRVSKPRCVLAHFLIACRWKLTSTSRPTHEHIERLQTRVDELEDLIRRLETLSPDQAAEAVHTWRVTGIVDAPRSQQQNEPPAGSSVLRVGEEHTEYGQSAEEAPNFESPIGGDYIYDREG